MPQILVRERDETTSAVSATNNFAVLVPGLVASGKGTAELGFDDNGVCELYTVSDFDEKVGAVAKVTEVRAGVPEVEGNNATAIKDGTTTGKIKDSTNEGIGALTIKASEAWTDSEKLAGLQTFIDQSEGCASGKLYIATKNTDKTVAPDKKTKGEYQICVTTATNKSNASYTWYKIAQVPADATLVLSDRPDGTIGGYYLSDSYLVIAMDGSDPKIGNNYEEAVEAVNGNTYISNQVARELLALGYPVLYKKIAEVADPSNPPYVSSTLNATDFWKPLADKSLYNFRYIELGLLTSANDSAEATAKSIYDLMISVANGSDTTIVSTAIAGRGDCVALIDVPKNTYSGATSLSTAVTEMTNFVNTFSGNSVSEYAAIFAPTVTYLSVNSNNSVYENNTEFPASFHYLACTALALPKYPEWFAMSGYTRGISSYTISSVGFKFGEEALRSLQPRTTATTSSLKSAVNLVITDRTGYYMWGNRTARQLPLTTAKTELIATHFLNVRQLCSTIKKSIYEACRSLMFDPNSDLLFLNFCNALIPLLESMKAQQGIKDYKFQKLETSKKAKLFAAVRIVPIEAVEDFEIVLNLEDSLETAEISEIDELL